MKTRIGRIAKLVMIPRGFRFQLLLISGTIFFLNTALYAKSIKPKTVVDYFMLLPQKGFFELKMPERKKWLYGIKGSVVDTKNDYLRMQGDGAQGSLQVALFRYKGRVLVAVYNEFEEGTLHFLCYQKGRWKDVTKATLPVPFNRFFTYTLPRYGTAIKVIRGNDFYRSKPSSTKAYDLVWRRGRFIVRRSREGN